MIINWKAKIGYGDIISPLLYAYNESVRRNKDINLLYLFPCDEEALYKPEDPETLTERIRFVDEHTNKSDITNQVDVEMDYHIEMPEDFNHTNYVDKNTGLHNLRFSNKYRWRGTGNHVAVITTMKNKEPFLGRQRWKDPIQGEWLAYLPMIPNSVLIDYETPIEVASALISTAKYAVTYHGSAAWLCKWIGIPMIVVTGKPEWSKTVFPWCETVEAIPYNMEPLVRRSTEKLSGIETKLDRYLKGKE